MYRSKLEVLAGVAAITAGLMLPTFFSAMASEVPPPPPGMQRLDTNHDGKISPQERQAAGHARFKALDANGDGFVTREEAMAEAEKRIAARTDRMFKLADTNGDGKISQAEFDAAGKKMRERAEARRHRASPQGASPQDGSGAPDAPADKPE